MYILFVLGLWPDGSDGTDINAVCSSYAKRLLVTGDDFGKVHLFSFPCSQSRVRNWGIRGWGVFLGMKLCLSPSGEIAGSPRIITTFCPVSSAPG